MIKVKKVSEKAGSKLNIQKIKVIDSSPITSWKIDGETNGNSNRLFSWGPKSLQMVIADMKLKNTPWKKTSDKPRQHIKKTETLLCLQRSI